MSKELAIIKPFKYHDLLTNDDIKVSVSDRFTKLSINHRDYFFDKRTGVFNGTGMDMSNDPNKDWFAGYDKAERL